MSDVLQLGQHPDADQLSAFAEQALPPHEREMTLAHLAGCSDCRRIVALSLPPLEEPPVAAPQPAVAPRFGGWFAGWRLAWIGAPALAALAIAAAVALHLRDAATARKAASPVQVAEVRPPAPQKAPALKSLPSDYKQSPVLHAALSANPAGPEKMRAPAPERAGGRQTAQPADGGGTGMARTASAPGQSIGGPVASGSTGTITGVGYGVGAGVGESPSGTARPAATKAQPAMDFALAAPSSAQPAPFPPATLSASAASVHDASSEGATDSSAGPVAAAYAPRTNGFVPVLARLPSGLPTVSIAANLHRRLALDPQHALFYSDDDGQHWKAVSTPWPGHAIAVATVPSLPVPRQGIVSAGTPSRFIGLPTSKPSTSGFAPSSIQPAAPRASAPNASGSSLSGTVKDSSGAVIPGASVVLKDRRRSIAIAGETGADGRYLFADLAPGSYQIEATARGFEKRSLSEEVAALQHAVADLILAVGQASETVSVAAASSQIEVQPQPAAGGGRAKGSVSTAATAAAAPAAAKQSPAIFFVVTETGARWTSADGLSWKRE